MTTTSDFLRHLRTLADRQANDLLSDRQLLERFLHQRSEASFAALVLRHGPMVLNVCRRILHHVHDAEDAFQATFLILARRANSIRKPESLSSWLHGVAYHSAECLRAKTVRRAIHERRRIPQASGDALDDITWRELRLVLDEELGKLPEKYRAPLVLCYLEARTQDEAARHLGWSKNTFGRRINQARQMLAQRLTRRGLTLPAVLMAPLLIDSTASAALPPLLAANTIRACVASATGQELVPLVSAQVAVLAEEGVAPLLVKKASIAVVVLVSLILGVGGLLAYLPAPSRTFAEAPSQSPPARSASKGEAIEIKGRVLDPDGKPMAGARLFLVSAVKQKNAEKPVRATTDQEGRFHFTAPPADLGPPGKGKIVATAKGFGLDWIDVDSKGKSEEITLRLVADDLPLSGRVLDLEGKPIAGVAIRVLRVGKMPGNADLKSWLDKNIEMRRKGTYLNEDGLQVIGADLPDLPALARTATDGTFRLTGFGRDRIVRLNMEGPTIVWRKAWAITRPGPARGFIPGRDSWDVYAAHFEYAAGPCKPILGIVREKGTGKPLAGIRVGSAMHGSVETTTGQDGRYHILGAAKNRSYCVVAEGDQHFNCTKMNIADTPGLEPITVDFELERGILIRGRLTNKATGEPVRGSVYYCALADNPNVKDFKEIASFGHVHLGNPFDTAAEGSFAALAIPGPGLLCVRADNGAFTEAKPLDAKGAPFQTVPNIVLTGHHALVPVDVSENDPKTHVYDIVLDPGRSVKGTVLGPEGQPLAGTRIVGLTALSNRNGADSAEKVGRKGADFTVTALAPGQDRQLVFLHPQKNLGKVLQLHGDEKGPLTVRLEPLGTLCGRMLTPAGQPLAGLTVLAAVGPGGHKVTTTTDKEGKFRVDGLLPEMRYLIVVGYGDLEKRSAIHVYREAGLSVESGKTKDLGDLKGKLTLGK